jgi:hypothetical protein
MNREVKFILALKQVENISSLLAGNEYEKFFISHLVPMKVELQRQLTNLSHSSKIMK